MKLKEEIKQRLNQIDVLIDCDIITINKLGIKHKDRIYMAKAVLDYMQEATYWRLRLKS